MAEKFINNRRETLLNVRQAANLLNLSVPTVKNYIYSGKLKSIKTPGGHHRILMSDLSSIMGVDFQEFEVNSLSAKIINELVKMIEKRDFSQGHAESVASISQEIASRLLLSEGQKKDLYLAAILHDIGKAYVDQEVLNKTSSLSEKEFSAIKKHPERGEEIIKSMGPFNRISSIVRQHHERFNGTGYPDGLSGNKISVEARIIAVAETFDFMTAKRPYKEPLPRQKAVTEIQEGINTQFDPQVVSAFLDLQSRK